MKDPISKPEYLREWDLCRQYHTMIWDGGLADQPYIWLLEQEVITQEATLMESLAAAAAQQGGVANG